MKIIIDIDYKSLLSPNVKQSTYIVHSDTSFALSAMLRQVLFLFLHYDEAGWPVSCLSAIRRTRGYNMRKICDYYLHVDMYCTEYIRSPACQKKKTK